MGERCGGNEESFSKWLVMLAGLFNDRNFVKSRVCSLRYQARSSAL